VIAFSTDGLGALVERESGTVVCRLRVPSRVSRLGAYRNRSSFVTGVGGSDEAIWVTRSDGSVFVGQVSADGHRWRQHAMCESFLTTSAAQRLGNSESLVLLGLEGSVRSIQLAGRVIGEFVG
jgi:hypothetical protein